MEIATLYENDILEELKSLSNYFKYNYVGYGLDKDSLSYKLEQYYDFQTNNKFYNAKNNLETTFDEISVLLDNFINKIKNNENEKMSKFIFILNKYSQERL